MESTSTALEISATSPIPFGKLLTSPGSMAWPDCARPDSTRSCHLHAVTEDSALIALKVRPCLRSSAPSIAGKSADPAEYERPRGSGRNRIADILARRILSSTLPVSWIMSSRRCQGLTADGRFSGWFCYSLQRWEPPSDTDWPVPFRPPTELGTVVRPDLHRAVASIPRTKALTKLCSP